MRVNSNLHVAREPNTIKATILYAENILLFMLYLDEDESFSLTAYVESLGEQRVALSGYLVDRRSDGVYVASLIPQLFYGWDGNQLGASWRQNIGATGEQVILSRSGGYPKVPKQELYWRKVSDFEGEKVGEVATAPIATLQLPSSWILPIGALIVSGIVIYFLLKK